MAKMIAKILDDKKGQDIQVLDVSDLTVITEYFVLVSARSDTQVKALRDAVEETMNEQGIEPIHRDGYRDARWVVLDYSGVIVHIFHYEQREFYNLERLWADAKTLETREQGEE